MHVVASWDIKAQNDRWNELNERLKAALKPHSWARPLTTFYVVKLDSEAERTALINRLVSVAKTDAAAYNIVVTPIMVGGQYNGWLPGDMWPKIAERSAE